MPLTNQTGLCLTKEQINQIEIDFDTALKINKKLELHSVFDKCSEDEKFLLRFLYAYMPCSDVVSYEPAFFLKHVRDMLEIRAKVSWGNEISEENFLHYVFPLRINNEDLTDYRKDFFKEIYPRIEKLSMKDAVLEINYWCFEKATYKSTDIRTLSPLAIMRNAHGRCGEESVLCVAALRSVGIPTRQCYTPRWAHCDDNHAWVEVWISGKWHFIGACEPEPILDSGWFAEPAQRSMLVHSRVFSGIVSEDDITNRTEVMSQVNILDNYTKTKVLEIYVKDSNGLPLENAKIQFELINYAQFYPIATIMTDKQGKASFKTGFGDLNVHVSFDSKFLYQKATANCLSLEFSMAMAKTEDSNSFVYDQTPPLLLSVATPDITDMMEIHEKRMGDALEKRKLFVSSFVQNENATKFAAKYPDYHEEIAKLIALSNGNHREIAVFLDSAKISLKYKVMLLLSLRKKDLSDITAIELEEHLVAAFPFHDAFNEEIFQKYILCPYVNFEKITDYRNYINNYFNEDTKKDFQNNPMHIYSYIDKNVMDCGSRDYVTLFASPEGLLKQKFGSEISRKILFVTICRTLGIPSRMSEVDQKLEYMKDGNWKTFGEKGIETKGRNCSLSLKNAKTDYTLIYEKHFTISRLKNGVYESLGLSDVPFENGIANYQLEEGQYRILTSNRLLDGSILAEIINVNLTSGKKSEITLKLREETADNHVAVALPDIPVISKIGEKIAAQKLIANGKSGIIAFLEESKEPTEHLLNEILEQSEDFKRFRDRFLLVIEKSTNAMDKLLQKAIDETGLSYATSEVNVNELSELISPLGMPNFIFPLILGFNSAGKCVFHMYGYNVGTGDLLINYLKTI